MGATRIAESNTNHGRAPAIAVKSASMPPRSISVLVVDDDQEINALVGAYVELCGFKYRSAFNGAVAMKELKAQIPSLVVLDLMLPDFDGFEICASIKSAEETRDIPVVILTALSGDEGRQRGRKCGADDYITKPFDPDLLMQIISRHARRT